MSTGGQAWQTSSEIGNTAPRQHTDRGGLNLTPGQSPMTVLSEATERQPWMAEGACLGADPEAWFPEVRHTDEHRRALAVCARCPVRHECFQYAMDHKLLGIWGGTTHHQRRELRELRRPRKAS